MPEHLTTGEVDEAIFSEKLRKIDDPYAALPIKMPEMDSTAHQIRDRRMAIIAGLINAPEIYCRAGRSALIRQVIDRTATSKKTVYAYLRQYWQRGKTPNALLPDYENSGAPGAKRKADKKKLGRPRVVSPGKGTIIDARTEKMFRMVLDNYHLTAKEHSFPHTHRRLEAMFQTANPDVAPEDYPTIGQLRHFYEREYLKPDRIRRRANKIEYQKDVRPLRSTATTSVHGPGGRYEIDATVADIYLLSKDRLGIIGRPTIYIVVDVYSRLITGFYVGLENPSYSTAMLALINAMTDKTEQCLAHGYSINPEDWPAVGLPDAILADRGELLGHQIEHLEQGFGIRIENAPPYRGDAKGIVERYFRTLQADFKPFAPGTVTGTLAKKRGGADYRLDATLTLHEFTKIILGSILHRNLGAVLVKYDRDNDMPSDLPPVPIHLWRWGIQNRSGRLRSASESAVRMALLPRQQVTLSEHGIKCFGAYYSCRELVATGWLHRNGQNRPGPFLAAYDPASADKIYVFPKDHNGEHWECTLTDRSRAYRGQTMWQLWSNRHEQKQAVAAAQVGERKSKIHLESIITETIKNAVKSRPSDITISKAKKLANIRQNRTRELEQDRERRKPLPEKHNQLASGNVIYLHAPPIAEAFPDFIDDLFGEDK